MPDLEPGRQELQSLLCRDTIRRIDALIVACESRIALRNWAASHGPAGTATAQLAWAAVRDTPDIGNVGRLLGELKLMPGNELVSVLHDLAEFAGRNPQWCEQFSASLDTYLSGNEPILCPKEGEALGELSVKSSIGPREIIVTIGIGVGLLTGGEAIGPTWEDVWKDLNPPVEIVEVVDGGRGKGEDEEGGEEGGAVTGTGNEGGEGKDGDNPEKVGCTIIDPEDWWKRRHVIYTRAPEANPANPYSHSMPGGVLFAPEMEVVISQDGLASRIEQDMTSSSMEGGGGVTRIGIPGKKIVAVAVPGSRDLFDVKAGCFPFVLPVFPSQHSPELRYYSGYSGDVGFGKGWSLAPYAIQLPSRGRRLFLVDFVAGTQMPYRKTTGHSGAKQDQPIAYEKISSSLQPDIRFDESSGYIARFLDGRELRFDTRGRLTHDYTGSSIAGKWTYEQERVTRLEHATRQYAVAYSDARATVSGPLGKAELGLAGGRLSSCTAPPGAEMSFRYDPHGFLAGASARGKALFENMYTQSGQLQWSRGGKHEAKYGYDRWVGKWWVDSVEGHRMTVFFDANCRVRAYGNDPHDMVLLNYDSTGHVFQVAVGEHVNAGDRESRPRFRVKELLISGS